MQAHTDPLINVLVVQQALTIATKKDLAEHGPARIGTSKFWFQHEVRWVVHFSCQFWLAEALQRKILPSGENKVSDSRLSTFLLIQSQPQP